MMTSLNDRQPVELTTIVWASFRDAYELSRRLEDDSTGWQLFLAIDDAVEESFTALKLEYVGDDVVEGSSDALLQRAANRINLAIDMLYVLANQGKPHAKALMVNLAIKANDAYERILHLVDWETAEREELLCN
jgi:hypothetical protein